MPSGPPPAVAVADTVSAKRHAQVRSAMSPSPPSGGRHAAMLLRLGPRPYDHLIFPATIRPMTTSSSYPIGTPGQPWSASEVAEWRKRQAKTRVYADDVLTAINALRE